MGGAHHDDYDTSVEEGERWRASGARTARRLESWSEILATTHVAFDVRPTWRTPAQFQGLVSRRTLDGLTLVDCAAAPFLGHRSAAVIDGKLGHEAILGFQFVAKGVELVRERGRQLAVSAGDIVLWDGLQPTEVEIIEPFFKRTLIFPRERVLALCPRLAELDALPPLDRNGPAALLVRYVNGLAAELPRLDSPARTAAANAALELLRGVIEPAVPPSRQVAREAMRAEIRRYVRAHLHEPPLGPATIAVAHSM